MTAITNYYKHTDLTNQIITLQFCVLEVQHGFVCFKIQDMQQNQFLQSSRENPFLCLFQLLWATTFLGSWSPLFIFKASNGTQKSFL